MLFLIALIAYLLGSFPSGYVLGTLFRKQDIRQSGSGNIGFTNMLRTFGKTLGILTLFLDLIKAILAMILADYLFGTKEALSLAMLFVFLGHCYTIFLAFQGGKGVASATACLFYLNWKIGVLVVLSFILVVYLSKIVSLASLHSASLAFTSSLFMEENLWVKIVILLCVLIIFYKHKDNIKRLQEGKEYRFSRKEDQ